MASAGEGGAGPKHIVGTPGNDIIRGTPGRDLIFSLGGNDVIYGDGGDDVIEAGDGADIVRGEAGNDSIDGGDGRDTLYGGSGGDSLDGEGGEDILHTTDGGSGNDAANGGPASDICHGDRGDSARGCRSAAAPGEPENPSDDDGRGGSGSGGEADDTASGRCRVTGSIVFADAVGFAPEQTTFTDYAAGTCTGTVNGRFMADERMYLTAAGGGLLGCGASRVASRGTLHFTRNTATRSDDVEVDYTARSQGSGGQIVSVTRGRVSGEVIASVRLRGDAETLRRCQAGTLRRGVYDMEGQSVRPLVG